MAGQRTGKTRKKKMERAIVGTVSIGVSRCIVAAIDGAKSSNVNLETREG